MSAEVSINSNEQSVVIDAHNIQIDSRFPNQMVFFNTCNTESFSDLKVIVNDDQAPLNLHRLILAQSCGMIKEVLSGATNAFAQYDANNHSMRFTFPELYQSALGKWLRFCYGENQTFKIEECPAALAVLLRLDMVGKAEIQKKLEEHMKSVSEKNADCGICLLRICAKQIEECHTECFSNVDQTITRCVFTKKNLMSNYSTLVEGCLLELPAEYLNLVEYGPAKTMYSEFAVRKQYLMAHTNELNDEEKVKILGHCDLGTVSSDELWNLKESGLIHDDSMLICLFHDALRSTETSCVNAMKQRDDEKKRAREAESILSTITSTKATESNSQQTPQSTPSSTSPPSSTLKNQWCTIM